MYCRKCGKYFDGNADLCAECAQNGATTNVENNAPQYSAPQYSAPQYGVSYNQTVVNVTPGYSVAPVRQGSRTAGLGFGIVGFIFAIVAAIIIGAGYGVALGAESVFKAHYNLSEYKSLLQTGVTTCWVGVVFAILPIIFGPIAISKFIKNKKATGVKAIPTLVFGIVCLVEAVSVILMGFVFISDISNALSILSPYV